MALDEVALYRVILNEVIGDVVENGEIGAGFEDECCVGKIGRAVLVGGQRHDLDVWRHQPAVDDAGPQNRMHLGHVRAPEHERIRLLHIVVTSHRLVHAEGAYETDGCRGHAVARVGIEIV